MVSRSFGNPTGHAVWKTALFALYTGSALLCAIAFVAELRERLDLAEVLALIAFGTYVVVWPVDRVVEKLREPAPVQGRFRDT